MSDEPDGSRLLSRSSYGSLILTHVPSGRRFVVPGWLTRDADGKPLRIGVTDTTAIDGEVLLEAMPDDDDLPRFEELAGKYPDFTGGLSAVDYVRWMRGDETIPEPGTPEARAQR